MSRYVAWEESLSVGIERIDNQHKHLITLINELQMDMESRKPRKALEKTITALFDYAQTHFQTEEEYFNTYDFPERAAHEEQHLSFIQKVFEFRKAFDENAMCLSADMMAFLSDWLITHIRNSDAKIREWITPQLNQP